MFWLIYNIAFGVNTLLMFLSHKKKNTPTFIVTCNTSGLNLLGTHLLDSFLFLTLQLLAFYVFTSVFRGWERMYSFVSRASSMLCVCLPTINVDCFLFCKIRLLVVSIVSMTNICSIFDFALQQTVRLLWRHSNFDVTLSEYELCDIFCNFMKVIYSITQHVCINMISWTITS